MFPCFDRTGLMQVVAWAVAARIVGQFDASFAAGQAAAAADPSFKFNPFADKPKGQPKTAEQALAAVCARARRAA